MQTICRPAPPASGPVRLAPNGLQSMLGRFTGMRAILCPVRGYSGRCEPTLPARACVPVYIAVPHPPRSAAAAYLGVAYNPFNASAGSTESLRKKDKERVAGVVLNPGRPPARGRCTGVEYNPGHPSLSATTRLIEH
jgi:hypothetical protein